MRSIIVSKLEPSNPNDNKYGLNSLTVPLLIDELRERGLSLSGNKPELRNRLLDFLKLQDEEVVDGTVDNTDEDNAEDNEEDDLIGRIEEEFI